MVENRDTELNYKDLVNKYLKVSDWRVKENSTVTYSVGGLILSNSGAITANYWLSEIYDQEIADAHRNADIHIHDLSMLTGYCAGWSLKQLIKEGLGGIPGKISSTPAGHLSTLCNQMVNFLGIMQNEWAGAQAFSSFDTYLAPFVKKDNLTYKEVKQCIQSFIFGVNTPSRWGTQAPFTNITLDWVCPNDLANLNAVVGGVEQNFKYKDCKKEMDMVNKAFIECMIEGDANGRGFQYPIPTYSITKDFDWSETENNKLLFEMTSKYGTPYFSNYINSDMEPSDVRSMCVTPDTKVYIKVKDNNISCTIKEMFENYNHDDVKIKTKYGYQPVKDWLSLPFKGNLLKFTYSNGNTLTTTPEHLHIIKDTTTDRLIKVRADNIQIGDTVSCIPESSFKEYNSSKKGKSIEEIYGEEKAKKLHTKLSERNIKLKRWQGENNPSSNGISQKQKLKISQALHGHRVSDKCAEASRNRWLGKKNPVYNENINHASNGSIYVTSKYEEIFAKELTSLNLDYTRQYSIPGSKKLADFFVPSKNLVIELETDYRCDKAAYNCDPIYVSDDKKERYDSFRKAGYNVLVFNPKRDDSSYRQYINNCASVISIEKVPYDGLVYDVEVNTDNIFNPTNSRTYLAHSFYANDILTSNCCRLRLDLRELRKKAGGFFGSGESTGSIGVVTINMPRIGYLATDKADFYARLERLMDISARSLKVKRNTITAFLEAGLYPYTKRYLGSFKNHFSTIGLVGMNECCLNARWIKEDLSHKEAQDFTKEVLNFMRNKLSDYQEQYGDLYNLEATPAESTAYRLAKHDKERYPDIITASGMDNDKTPYYTNSSHLPVSYTEDVFSALDIQDGLQTLYTSGTVFHTFLGEKLPSWQSCMGLVRKIAENYHIPYFTISPTYSVCEDHGYLAGEVHKCPICGKETEIYSRITGYYRPVKNWNAGKTEEFAERREYSLGASRVIPKDGTACNCEDKSKGNYKTIDEITLFASKTCPNCNMAKMLLDKAGIKYRLVDAEANKEETIKFGVKKAPTLLVPDGDSYDVYENASLIKGYIEETKK